MTIASFDLVLVGYRPADSRLALRFCDRFFGGGIGRGVKGPGVRRKVFVANRPALAADVGPLPAGWELVAGSNALAEFSGWQEGFEALGGLGGLADGVVFANDTLSTHRHFTAARARAFAASLATAPAASLIGFQDDLPGLQVAVAGLPLDAWVSTYCFALSAEALVRLEGRLYDLADVTACVPGSAHDEDRFFDRLSPDLNRHLRGWLFGGGWYAGGRLTAENSARMTFKARCIVAEKLLSARCRAQQVRAVDPFGQWPRLRLLDRILRGLAREWRALLARARPTGATTRHE